MAVETRVFARCLVSTGICVRIRGKEFAKYRRRHHRPLPISHLGRQVAGRQRTMRTIEKLRSSGKVRAVGISMNRWEPWNGIRAVKSGLVDAVQVIYNIFDQNPEDQLFPACRAHDVAVIARVPFDEGSLTGHLTLQSTWPADDWRS